MDAAPGMAATGPIPGTETILAIGLNRLGSIYLTSWIVHLPCWSEIHDLWCAMCDLLSNTYCHL